MAPVGVQAIFHEDKETGLSEVCAEIGVPYILSTAATSSIEEVAKSNGAAGHRWFQLYWPAVDEVTVSLLNRAKQNGYKVLVVTLDAWTLAWRPADLDEGYVNFPVPMFVVVRGCVVELANICRQMPFLKGTGNKVGFTDPVFRERYEKKTGLKIEDNLIAASVEWLQTLYDGGSHGWNQIAHLKKHWDGPIVLKGIQHVEDAKLAVKAGVQGIVVSNHGGKEISIAKKA